MVRTGVSITGFRSRVSRPAICVGAGVNALVLALATYVVNLINRVRVVKPGHINRQIELFYVPL